jgi:glycine hydroxymethyltransferase
LILVDLRNKSITGKDAEKCLDEIGVTVNKNTIPFDPQSPFVTSGIRIGTPAMTTRGMKENEMVEIAEIIALAIENKASTQLIKEKVQGLCQRFPLYR